MAPLATPVTVTVGAVLSMLIAPTAVEAVLPALSRAVPSTDCAAPSPCTRLFGPQLFTAERSSLQLKVTITSVLFQPKPFAAGRREPEIVGFTLSMLIADSVADALL